MRIAPYLALILSPFFLMPVLVSCGGGGGSAGNSSGGTNSGGGTGGEVTGCDYNENYDPFAYLADQKFTCIGDPNLVPTDHREYWHFKFVVSDAAQQVELSESETVIRRTAGHVSVHVNPQQPFVEDYFISITSEDVKNQGTLADALSNNPLIAFAAYWTPGSGIWYITIWVDAAYDLAYTWGWSDPRMWDLFHSSYPGQQSSKWNYNRFMYQYSSGTLVDPGPARSYISSIKMPGDCDVTGGGLTGELTDRPF